MELNTSVIITLFITHAALFIIGGVAGYRKFKSNQEATLTARDLQGKHLKEEKMLEAVATRRLEHLELAKQLAVGNTNLEKLRNQAATGIVSRLNLSTAGMETIKAVLVNENITVNKPKAKSALDVLLALKS